MAIRNSLIEAYGLNSPGVNLLNHAGNHDYQSFGKANDNESTQIVYDNINNYVSVTQPEDVNLGIYRILNSIIIGEIYNLSFYAYSDTDCDFLFGIASASEVFGSSLHVNAGEWTKCWCVGKASNTTIAFYTNSTSFKIRNIKFTKCTSADCYFFQYTDINDELKPFVYNFKDLQTNCRYTEYFANDNPINELISWENFKYPLKEFVEREEWQYSNDKSYRTRNTTSIIDWCDGSNKSSVSNIEREDATIEYGTPELTLVVDDIPASGGTISDGTVSYGQSKYYVYSDTRFKITDESGIITDGLTWGDSVTAQSLGTTIKDRSVVGSLSVSTTINGKTESTTVDVYQQANKIESYGIPTGRTLSVSDIPASGGTISRGTLGGTITQSCTYTSGSNGTLTNPTITSSSYSNSITADSLGTTIKDRTKIGTLTYTYVCNKRTGSISADVYQEANKAIDITYGDWSVSLSANKYTTSSSPAPAGGGTAAITSSASRSRIQNYTSGATSKLSNETVSPSLSVTGSGFSLSGSNVIVANRTTTEGAARTGSVTATHAGVSKSIALYQAENKLVAVSATGSASTGTVLNVFATGGTVTWSPVVEYSSGSNVPLPSGVTITYSVTGEGATQSNNITTWANRGSIIGSWRGANVILSAKSSYTTNPIKGIVSTGQNMNTITDARFIDCQGGNPKLSFPASGWASCYVGELTLSSGLTIHGSIYKDYMTYSFDSDFGVWELNEEGYYGTVSASSRGYILGAEKSGTLTYKISGTINGVSINKSTSITITQEANIVTAVSIVNVSGGTPTSSFTAAGSSGYNYYGKATYSSGNTQLSAINAERFSYTLSGTGFSKSDATNKSYTKVIVDNRTTTIGNSRTGSLVVSFTNPSFTGYTNTVSSSALTLTQDGNYVTNLSIVASSLSYPTISASATSATPTMSGGSITFTYSSGSISGDAPSSTYGTLTTTRKYTLGSVVNGFTAVNADTGVLTATNRGTTIGPARTSGIVTYTATMTWTPTSSYNAEGVKTASDKSTATCTQALNKVVSCTETNNTLSYPSIAAAGGTSNPSDITTARFTYSSGANGDPSGYVWTKSFSMTSANGFSINTTSGVVTATNNTTTSSRTSNTITRTAKISYTNPSSVGGDTVSATLTKTATCTQSAGVKTYANPVVSLSYAAIPAKGGTVSPTLSYSQTWGWNGSTSGGGTITSGATVSYLGTSVNTTSGAVSAASKWTAISNVTTITTATAKVELNGKTGTKSATVQQSGNYVVSINVVGSSFQYADIGAGATSANPGPFSGGSVTYTFSSGSTSTTAPSSTYGSYSVSTTYSLGSVVNGFTAVNSSSGVLTATSRGTVIGPARTSGVVTKTTKGTWTPVSYYSAAGIKTDTDNKTATCTQALNTVTSIDIRACGGATEPPTVSYPAAGAGYCFSFSCKYSSGLDVESSAVDGLETWSFNQPWGSWAPTSENRWWGILTIPNRGTTIGAARSGTLTCTVKGTINGVSINASDSVTITQALNKLTALAIIPSADATDTTSYPTGNFAASGGTKTPTTTARVVATFSSGSPAYTGASGAWYGGTLSISRSWSMVTATGFSMNTSTGAVTASNRGTTEGLARTCTPKCVISASYTNPASVGSGVVTATQVTDTFTLTQAANSMTRDYSNLVGHISSTTWANKANYTSFWATGDYTERYTSGATGASGSGSVPWDSVTFGGADWVYYDSVQGILKWYDNTGLERSTTITGRIGSWTYSVKVTQKAGMSIGRLYLHVPVNVGYIGYWNIYVNSTSGGQIWSGHPDESGSANNTLKMPEECAIIVAQNGGTVSFSTTYSTATDRNYRGSISGTEQDRLADGEDVTVYLT